MKVLRKWNNELVVSRARTRFKSSFKKSISAKEVKDIWSDFVSIFIEEELKLGREVYLFGNKFWVKATPVVKHKRALSLLKKGKIYLNGRIVDADINFDSAEFIYKIMYKSDYYKKGNKVFFKAHRSISKAVNEGIKNRKLITRL